RWRTLRAVRPGRRADGDDGLCLALRWYGPQHRLPRATASGHAAILGPALCLCSGHPSAFPAPAPPANTPPLPLPGCAESSFSFDGTTRPVYRRGTGPGVVVMPEIPGITPQVAAFAERVAAEGFTVFVASLFGTPGRPLSPLYAMGQLSR